MVQAGGLYWLIRPSNESALGRLIGCRASCQAGTSTRMLAVGDKCIYRESCCAAPEFGALCCVDMNEDGCVLFLPIVPFGKCKWVKWDCVSKVKSIGEGTTFGSSEAYSNGSVSVSGPPVDKDEHLCSRMDMVHTLGGAKEQTKVSKKQMESYRHEWRFGDVCVCRWWKNNKWYFAKISNINEVVGFCDVQLLYYGNKQYFIRLDRIHRVDASSWKWVEDEENASAALELLRSGNMKSYGMTLERVLPELEAQSESMMEREGRGERGLASEMATQRYKEGENKTA
ncbi:hypothetical protein TcWFU_001424 [Taenia crassiceps]|uniref:Tudor domain-containing protein n=1 Tax=Taenia crassiceps TaxID=6207 RepID=A0ABR4QJ97_9CEST